LKVSIILAPSVVCRKCKANLARMVTPVEILCREVDAKKDFCILVIEVDASDV